MKQTSTLTRQLTDAQVEHTARKARSLPIADAVVYTLYTEDKTGLLTLVSRYFDGATVTRAIGLWKSDREAAVVITIIGASADRQKVFDLAGDIRIANNQTAVLITWQNVSRFDVTEDSIRG